MKNIFLLFTFCMSFALSAQENVADSLQTFYENQEYDLIISKYAEKAESYPARAVYYIGMAYYMKEDNTNCLKYMDLSIQKDAQDFDPYYIKGMTYNYMNQVDDAISSFEKAIEINPETSYAYTALGDSYLIKEIYDKALDSYQKACLKEDATDRAYFMIPQIYASQNDSEKALEAFYMAKANISKESESYNIVLYNIGLFELLKFEYEKAEIAYQELLTLSPEDYETHSKLVQVYYGKKDYEKAEPFRNQLYEAHRKGLLNDHLKDMFCIDQFQWKDKSVRVFERYQEKPDDGKIIFNKHLFYILDEKGEIESRIQTEYSAVSLELGGPKYLLGMNKGKGHYTFSRLAFNDPVVYDDLKSAVLRVLNKEVKPTSSSFRE